jgi:predicted DNA-binding transcriptional regulator YafY
MNRIDRLFGILLMLQRKPKVRAQDLADSFEVTTRTIYRDIAALGEMGVPVVTLPGEGYTLVEGFYLPPLIFTPDEASALFLGGRMLALQASGKLTAAAESALTKIANILPDSTHQQAQRLAEIIRFFVPPDRFDLDDPKLARLQQAIFEKRVVHLRYHSYSHDEVTEREVEPHYLSYAEGAWYVNGYCRLRQDIRGFRLDRIEDLKLLEVTFKPRQVTEHPPERITVNIRFAPETARWVRERQHYGFVGEEVRLDGVVMTYRVEAFFEIQPWILAWGARAEVLSPLALRAAIFAEVETILHRRD